MGAEEEFDACDELPILTQQSGFDDATPLPGHRASQHTAPSWEEEEEEADNMPALGYSQPSTSTFPSCAQTSGRVFAYTWKDPVHDHCELRPELKRFIDTPVFQRLRNLKQLGLTHFIYQSASHTRFEHSLGVAHMAGVWHRKLVEQSGLQFDSKHHLLLQLAGLCHDLGHAPFSHVFEKEVLPRVLRQQREAGSSQPQPQASAAVPPAENWHHEAMSEALLDHLVAEHIGGAAGLAGLGLTQSDMGVVKAMIRGKVAPGWEDTPFLFRIVANSVCGVDVDKMDYLLRDAWHTGVRVSMDADYIMSRCKVIDGELRFASKLYPMLLTMLHDRAALHDRIYQHSKTKAVEFMLGDALAEAEPELRLLHKLRSVHAFCALHDGHVLSKLEDPDYQPAPDNAVAWARAQGLFRRLMDRDLYTCVYEGKLAPGQLLPKAAQVVAHAAPGSGLGLGDVEVSELLVNYGKKDKNPLGDSSLFFGGAPDFDHILTPATFQMRRVRVYCKAPKEDAHKVATLKAAAHAWGAARRAEGAVACAGVKAAAVVGERVRGEGELAAVVCMAGHGGMEREGEAEGDVQLQAHAHKARQAQLLRALQDAGATPVVKEARDTCAVAGVGEAGGVLCTPAHTAVGQKRKATHT